jgi:hypothetical protein
MKVPSNRSKILRLTQVLDIKVYKGQKYQHCSVDLIILFFVSALNLPLNLNTIVKVCECQERETQKVDTKKRILRLTEQVDINNLLGLLGFRF